ncbi:ABC transporter permease [Moritella viscosa]
MSDTYPLRGELLVSPSLDASQAVAANSPKSGEAWLEAKGLRQLGIKLGDSIEVGVMRFKVTGVITQIPDASFSVFRSGPVVFINTQDVQRTKLIQPGSRLSYKYLFAGEADNITAFEQWFKPQLTDNQRWYDIKSQNSPLARALTKADKYLSLASMLGIVLASVAVAVASRRYSQRHQSVVAVFKAMGASKRYVTKLYCLHWSLLSVLSISLGLIVGYLILNIGLYAMRDYLDTSSTGNMAYPFLVAIVTGIICAVAFAITPLRELVNTSPMTLLRGRDSGAENSLLTRLIGPLPAIFAIFTLLYLFSQDAVLSAALLIGGMLVAFVLLVYWSFVYVCGTFCGQ